MSGAWKEGEVCEGVRGTGGRSRQVRGAGGELEGIYEIRTVADCEAIKAECRPDARVVVVGMGFIGSEVAASLRQLGLEVTVVLDGAVPLAKVLGAEVGGAMADIHRQPESNSSPTTR